MATLGGLMNYNEWIDLHYPDRLASYGNCAEAVQKMKAAYPELVVKRGVVQTDHGEREHWWLVTAEGEVVDPTKKQFTFIFDYEELDDNHPKCMYKRGRCKDCGEYYLIGKDSLDEDFCSTGCRKSFIDYLNRMKMGDG